MDTKTLPDRAVPEDTLLPGQSPPMLALKSAIARLARERAPVLVHGETGSGKERVARHLHRQAGRPDRDFHAVPAAELDPALAPRLAGDATLFIDAIEELAAPAQAALLHFLQAGDGGCRILAASQADAAALGGALRPDLANRLATLRLAVPPLRERREDLPGLVSLLLTEIAPGRELRLTDAAATAVVLHSWPGNVRELRNRLAQAVLLADGNALTPDMLGLAAPGRPNSLSLREMRQAAEREAITRALRQSQGQVPAAAAMLGISRAQLYRLISRLKLDHHAVVDALPVPERVEPAAAPKDPSRNAMS